jgi:methylthioribose-1-phosphate isomerase
MLVKGTHYRTLWREGPVVRMIDQQKLPFQFEIFDARDHRATAEAIRTMVTRGAGAIGAAAGYAMAQAALEAPPEPAAFLAYIEAAAALVRSTRPTAQNLFAAVDQVLAAARAKGPHGACAAADALADADAEACRAIGEAGAVLIKDGARVLTHCNAGWLAFTDWGTALSPLYAAHRAGRRVFVWADETRPRLQGARLTAWELAGEGVEHRVIPDNAAGHYMARGEVDLVIVGADRIAANGDTANKIGTYEKAVLARESGIPFYVAAPLATVDVHCRTGAAIPIEERGEHEVLFAEGPDADGHLRTIRVASPAARARNPAFDVTPARLIAGIITEKGIVAPGSIADSAAGAAPRQSVR